MTQKFEKRLQIIYVPVELWLQELKEKFRKLRNLCTKLCLRIVHLKLWQKWILKWSRKTLFRNKGTIGRTLALTSWNYSHKNQTCSQMLSHIKKYEFFCMTRKQGVNRYTLKHQYLQEWKKTLIKRSKLKAILIVLFDINSVLIPVFEHALYSPDRLSVSKMKISVKRTHFQSAQELKAKRQCCWNGWKVMRYSNSLNNGRHVCSGYK